MSWLHYFEEGIQTSYSQLTTVNIVIFSIGFDKWKMIIKTGGITVSVSGSPSLHLYQPWNLCLREISKVKS